VEIQNRAVLDYLQRKVPERLKEIRAARGDTGMIRDILRRRTKNRQLVILSEQAEGFSELLQPGIARM